MVSFSTSSVVFVAASGTAEWKSAGFAEAGTYSQVGFAKPKFARFRGELIRRLNQEIGPGFGGPLDERANTDIASQTESSKNPADATDKRLLARLND